MVEFVARESVVRVKRSYMSMRNVLELSPWDCDILIAETDTSFSSSLTSRRAIGSDSLQVSFH